jgi:phosphatidylglycerophosphate synthase
VVSGSWFLVLGSWLVASGSGGAGVSFWQKNVRMFDRSVRKLIDPLLAIPARGLVRWGVSANTITIAGFVIGMSACGAIACGWYRVGLTLILLNRLADGLDGMVARQREPSDLGGFLDIVLDLVFYGGVPMAFAWQDSARLLPACFLIYSFMGTSGSFLAFAVISAKRGITTDPEAKKSFFYSVGLMEGTETVLFYVAFCLFPSAFNLLAVTFGTLCWVTTLIRVLQGVRTFRK